MSLVRLLTSGKALVTLRDLPSAYRMRRDGWLPKFGSVGDPFRAKAPAAVAEATALPQVVQGKGATASKSFWPWSPLDARSRYWAALRSKAQEKRDAVKDAREAVQGELSLETVKVVRNDLHNSDVDLIPGSARTESQYRQVASNLLSKANAAEQALDRLAARIAGAEAR